MVDMKLSDAEKKDLILPEPPKYPHGLRICLGPEELSKLGLQGKPEIAAEYMMDAKVEVMEVEICEEKGDDKQYRVVLQIKDLGLKKEAKAEPAVEKVIYGE